MTLQVMASCHQVELTPCLPGLHGWFLKHDLVIPLLEALYRFVSGAWRPLVGVGLAWDPCSILGCPGTDEWEFV